MGCCGSSNPSETLTDLQAQLVKEYKSKMNMDRLSDALTVSVFDFLTSVEYFQTISMVSKRWMTLTGKWNFSIARRLDVFKE